MCTRLSYRHRHGGVQVAGAASHLSTQDQAAQPLRARLAATLGPLDHQGTSPLGSDQCGHSDPWGPKLPPLGRGYRPATFASAAARKRIAVPDSSGEEVIVWVDSFSDYFAGDAIGAAASVLAAAGYAPQLVERPACCGLTWISTGQLDGARRQLRTALDILHPYVAAGTPVIGLEPSCLAVWRSDAAELLPDDPRVADVAAGTFTLAELLERTPNWSPPDLSDVELVVQPHCHHASVLGWQVD